MRLPYRRDISHQLGVKYVGYCYYAGYNAAKTLKITYHSIPMQIIDKVILTDDVSQDETVEIAHKLGLKTIIHV
jgi:hypothetical protein